MSAENARFASLLGRMGAAICAGNAEGAAACFTPGGIYHDGFYGAFTGRSEITRMVRELFHRDARDFAWTFSGAVSDGRTGYARYEFSYVSKMAGSEGRQVRFSGVSCCELEGDLIRRYGEVFERAPVLVQLGFPDERILKSVKRWAKAP
jgi:hypothetical protein